MLRGKLKKLRVLAIAAVATVTMAGGCQANVLTSLTGFGSSNASEQNINMGSYQNNDIIEVTTGSEVSLSSRKVGLSDFVKEYDPKHSLGVSALVKRVTEDSRKKKFNSDVDTAFAVSNGRRSPYGSVGCVETVTYAGSYYSPALKEAFYKGIAYVPTLLANLSAKGFSVEPFNGFAEKGDLLVYGDDDHVVIADGQGGCFGNSSSRLRAMYYADAAYAWGSGQLPSKIVRMFAQG